MAINQPSFQQIQRQPGGQTPSGVQNALGSMQAQQQNRIAMYAPIAQQLGPVGLAALAQVDPGARVAMNDLGLGPSERYLDDYTKGVIAHATGNMSDEDFFAMQQQSPSRPFNQQQEQNLRMLFARSRPATVVEGGGTTEVTDQNQINLNLGQGGQTPPPPVEPDPVINEGGLDFSANESAPTGDRYAAWISSTQGADAGTNRAIREAEGQPAETVDAGGVDFEAAPLTAVEQAEFPTTARLINELGNSGARIKYTDAASNSTPQTIMNDFMQQYAEVPEEQRIEAVRRGMTRVLNELEARGENPTKLRAALDSMGGALAPAASQPAAEVTLQTATTPEQIIQLDPNLSVGNMLTQIRNNTGDKSIEYGEYIRRYLGGNLGLNPASIPQYKQRLLELGIPQDAVNQVQSLKNLVIFPQRVLEQLNPQSPQSAAPTQGTLRNQISQGGPAQGVAPQLGQQLSPDAQTTDQLDQPTQQPTTPEQAEESRVITEQEALAHLEATGNPAMVKPRTGEHPPTFGFVNPESGEVTQIELTAPESRNFAESIAALQDPNTSESARSFHQNRLRNLSGRYGEQVIQQTQTTIKENPEVRRQVIESTDAVLQQWNEQIKADPETMFQFLPETTAARQAFRTQEINNANTEAKTNQIQAQTRQLERVNEQFDWVREALGDEAFKAMQVEQFQLELDNMRDQNRITSVEADYAEQMMQARINYTEAQAAAMGTAGAGVGMDGAAQMLEVLTTMMDSPFVEGNEQMQAQMTELMFALSGMNVSIERNPLLKRIFGPEWNINMNPMAPTTTPTQEATSQSTSDDFINAVE